MCIMMAIWEKKQNKLHDAFQYFAIPYFQVVTVSFGYMVRQVVHWGCHTPVRCSWVIRKLEFEKLWNYPLSNPVDYISCCL